MRDLLELASRVAAHDTTVLITGESGTGKEVLARAIHRMSARCDGPLRRHQLRRDPRAAARVRALRPRARRLHRRHRTSAPASSRRPTDGHAAARRDRRPPAGLQAKLLRVLEEREMRRVGESKSRPVDVRVIAATARRLEDARAAGEFRDDLYYRLNVVELELPPLRDRPEDVPALLAHFAQRTAKRLGHPVSFSPQALATLSHYQWPGNVRELRNAVERAAVLSETGPPRARGLPARRRPRAQRERQRATGTAQRARTRTIRSRPATCSSRAASRRSNGTWCSRRSRPAAAAVARPPTCSA